MYNFLLFPLANVCQRSEERQQKAFHCLYEHLTLMGNKRLTLMIKPENTFDSNAFRCICLSVVEFLLCFISKDSLSVIQLTMNRFHKIQNGVVNKPRNNPTNAFSITGTVFLRRSIQMACNDKFRFVFRRTCFN